jgi:lactate dehydrogenase-like 2-hydroxyacid dehydrogenase
MHVERKMGMSFKLLRLDCEVFAPSSAEKGLVQDAGIDNFIEMEGYDPDMIRKVQPDAISVVSGYIRRPAIMGLDHCRAIMRLGNGYDKIDVSSATEKGILVTNIPGFCAYELAEHSMALLLSSARRLSQVERSMYDGTFVDLKSVISLHRVHGSTLGLIGFGQTAKNVAAYAHAMGMKILDYHRHVEPEIEAEYHATPVDLDTLLKTSDYVMILCPLTDETRGMIGERELKLMKKTATLINTARGAICDEVALARALREKWIAYAAIDVYEHINIFERPKSILPCLYFGLDNVLLTPHIGAYSVEASNEQFSIISRQLACIVSYRLPPNCINPEAAKITNLWKS